MITVVPTKLSIEVASLLEARIHDEYNAFFFYRSASNWCQDIGYEKAAKFFAKEAESELGHAKKIESYMVDWNTLPSLAATTTPPFFSGLDDIISQAYKMEYALYEEYEDTSAKIFEMKDLCVFDFLQEYRVGQKDAVTEYADMINKLSGVNTMDKFQMLMLEKNLFA
jgi:ferritin